MARGDGDHPRDRRRIGMRIWLGAAFATVGLITAASVYLFVSDSSGRTLTERSTELAIGQAVRLSDEAENSFPAGLNSIVAKRRGDNFEAWVVNREGEPITNDPPAGPAFDEVERGTPALNKALDGERYVAELPDDRTVVALPLASGDRVKGAVLARATPPEALRRSIEDLRGDSLRALAIAIAVGILIGFIAASLIAIRIKRLARSAERMARGRFDVPLDAGGRDEISDLGRGLDAMREALRESFNMLATERDRLGAILDGLTEAVIVVSKDGQVRFSNPAAAPLIRNGTIAPELAETVRRTAEEGVAEHPSLQIRDRVYALHGQVVPAERAVLVVVRDRTEELRRELAEREFISNAAHELRNPIAGISGAIEVLQAGAKDDPEAREHFLRRLAEDADRITRLTQSLLTLARVEAVAEESGVPDVDVSGAAEEAVEAIVCPTGIEMDLDVEPGLVASGDLVLLRQVLIGLLTNACKNTPPPGTVSLRAGRLESGEVNIEVEDTGTGIPVEEQDRVFERFYRGSASLETEGFGLGLSIAKRMVDVMGGRIGVRSEEGKGSTFWVRLKAPRPVTTEVA